MNMTVNFTVKEIDAVVREVIASSKLKFGDSFAVRAQTLFRILYQTDDLDIDHNKLAEIKNAFCRIFMKLNGLVNSQFWSRKLMVECIRSFDDLVDSFLFHWKFNSVRNILNPFTQDEINLLLTYEPSLFVDNPVETPPMAPLSGTFNISSGDYNGKSVMKVNFKISSDDGTNWYREAFIMQMLRYHSGVLKFLGMNNADSPSHLILECPMCSLDKLLDREDDYVDIKQKVAIIHQCCGIFASLASEGIFHRDIRDRNIFLMSDDTIRITNFGFFHLTDATSAEDVAHIAPELLVPELRRPSCTHNESSEMYSFAVLMNRIMSNDPTMSGKNLFQRNGF